MIRSHDARIKRSQIGAATVASDDWLDVVIAVPRRKRADDCQLVGQRGESRKRAAECYTGNFGGDFARRAADTQRGRHLGIEHFDLTGTAMQKEEDDRLSGGEPAGRGGRRWTLPYPRQRQSPEGQTAHLQEFATAISCVGCGQSQHSSGPVGLSNLKAPTLRPRLYQYRLMRGKR